MKMEAGNPNSDSSLTNLIINYLPQDFRSAELYAMFITMGPIVSHRVMVDKQTGYSFGYGFVDFENPEDAAKAIENLNGLQLEKKKIKVAYARPCNRDELTDNNLYIRRLPRDITEDGLQELFGQFGVITQKKLLKDTVTGCNRGVGFVRFSKRSEAQAAIEALHDKVPPGGTETLSVRVASDQKKQNMAFYAGFLESQRYSRGELLKKPRGSVASLKALPSKELLQNARQVTPSSRTLLPLLTSSSPSQDVAFNPREPSVGANQHQIFRPPQNLVNRGNFAWPGNHTGFMGNICQIPPPFFRPATAQVNNRPLGPWKHRNSSQVRFNAISR